MTVQTTSLKNSIELLEVFHIGLVNGLMDKQEVVKWADDIIQKDEQPDYFVIELSLCGHKSVNEMVSLINEFIGEPKPAVSGRVILGLLYHRYINGQVTLKNVVGSMNWIIWQGQLTEEEKRFMYGLDDRYDLAVDLIYSTVDAIEKEALRFLEIYKGFSIDNFERWGEINNTIEERVKELTLVVSAEQEKITEELKRTRGEEWWKFWKN